MPTYQYPNWRRVLFIAPIIVILILSYAPSLIKGTITLRIYSPATPSAITHVYISLTKMELHEAGLPQNCPTASINCNTGWTTIVQGFPNVDLLSNTQQTPQQLATAQINSGRYDTIRLTFTNSTLTRGGHNVPLAAPTPLNANITLPVPPNGIGDLLLVVSFDYTTLFANQPTLTLTLIRALAV